MTAKPLGVTARARAAKARKDALYAAVIRRHVLARDGGCRYARALGHTIGCGGALQWCHLGDLRRFKTRGLPPEARHTTAGTVCLCGRHHDDYDGGRLLIEGDDANGRLEFARA